MKSIFFAISAVCTIASANANAKFLAERSQVVSSIISSVLLEVTAKCRPPQFENGAYAPFFSQASYDEVKPYIEVGYTLKLVDKTCGEMDSGNELSSTDFETVRILLVNGTAARESLEQAITEVWSYVRF